MRVLTTMAVAALAVVPVAGAASAQLDDSITILHGIPGITVDLVVDDEIVIAGFDAGDTQDFTPLAGRTLNNIEARESGGDRVVIGPIDSFDVPAEGNHSVVVHLDAVGEPTLTAFVNEDIPTDQGRGLLTVRHAAAAPPVGIEIDGAEVLSGVGNGEGQNIVLPAGEIVDSVVTAGGERIASMPTLQLEANTQLVVYVGGAVADDSLAFYLQVVAGGGVESLPTPSERQAPEQATPAEQPVEQGDGTPQPDVVNTGNSLVLRGHLAGPGAHALLLGALGIMLVAVGTTGATGRRRPDSSSRFA